MSINLEKFVQKRIELGLVLIMPVAAVSQVLKESQTVAENNAKNIKDEELVKDITALNEHMNAISDFVMPEDPDHFYEKATEEDWKKINEHAQQLNSIMNKPDLIEKMMQSTNSIFDEDFFTCARKMNEYLDFELNIDQWEKRVEDYKPKMEEQKEAEEEIEAQKEAKEEHYKQNIFEKHGWTDIEVNVYGDAEEKEHKFDNLDEEDQKEQFMDRLRGMSPVELGDFKKKHEQKLADAEKFKKAARDLSSHIRYKEVTWEKKGYYKNNEHYLNYKKGLNDLNELGSLSDDTKTYIPGELIASVEKTVDEGEKLDQKINEDEKIRNAYTTVVSSYNDFMDALYDSQESIKEDLSELKDAARKVPMNVDINKTIEKQHNKLDIINDIMEERELSADDLEAAVRTRDISETNKSLGETFTKAKATNKKVRNGSKQFDNALDSIERYMTELDKYQKLKETKDIRYEDLSEAAKNMQEKAKEAKEFINKYFERKKKELWNNAKSKERMGLMNDSLEAINKADKMIADDKAFLDKRSIATEKAAVGEILDDFDRRETLAVDALADVSRKLQEKKNAAAKQDANKAQIAPKRDFEAILERSAKETEVIKIRASIEGYKKQSEEHKKEREASDEQVKKSNTRTHGTIRENAALVAAESIEELAKLSKNEALSPEQKKIAVEHIARVYVYETDLFGREKNVTAEQFKENVRPLADTNEFTKKAGELTPTGLKEFCFDPAGKTKQIMAGLSEKKSKERLKNEVLSNKKKQILKSRNEEMDMKRLKASKLESVDTAPKFHEAPTKKPKAMGR